MTVKKYIGYLEDILNAVDSAQKFIKGMDNHQFNRDEKTQYACIRALEIIGEAANKLPQSFMKRYPEIPWKEMIGMRHKLIHDYMGVNSQVLWKTIVQDLPELKFHIKEIIERR